MVGQGAIGLLDDADRVDEGLPSHSRGLGRLPAWNYQQKYGADAVINAKKEDVLKTVRKLTKMGSDFVIEAAGTTATVEQTPFLVKKTGKVALVGESKGFLNLEDADEV